MKRNCILFICLIWVLSSSFSENFNFRHISSGDGLASSTVNTIIQDSDGYMWFGTQDGLCRYDGYRFLNFVHSPDDPNSLSNNIISCLAEDANGVLWIGTRNGINKLNLDDYKVERVPVLRDSITSVPVQSIVASRNGKLYFGVDFNGLYCMDLSTQEVNNYMPSIEGSISISSNLVYALLEDPKHGIWVGTNKGLSLFDPKSKTFSSIIKNEDVRFLHFDQDSSISVGIVSKGNYYYKLHGDLHYEKKRIPLDASTKNVLPFYSNGENKWVAIRDKGLYYSNKVQHFDTLLVFQKYNFNGISSNAITFGYEDSWGNIWLGTYDAGINLFEKKKKDFLHVRDNFQPNGLRNNKVRSLFQDSEGDIWVGTKVNGTLSKFDRKTLTFTHFEHNPTDPSSISNDLIMCIEEDHPGYLWVGTSNGLNYLDKKSGKFTIFRHDNTNANSIYGDYIYALYKDGDKLFIGYLENGMDIYSTKDNTFIHYGYTGDEGGISDNRVRVFYKDRRGNIWIGTSNGLNAFNMKTGRFTHYINNSNDTTSISENTIQSIYEDADNNIWIGTNWGFNKMDRNTGTFKRFSTKHGLAGNATKGILGDDNGNLWISTNNGISKYNPRTEEFKNYNVYDGLQANEFSAYVFCKTQNGELLFGGNNGFNIFNPRKIVDNNIVPVVHITDFKLLNQSVEVGAPNSPLKKHISKSKELTLKFKQSAMTFEYAALNYISPEKNQYAFMMEGFESQWNYVGSKRSASYTSLLPGSYTFRVKAANNDGYWNEEGTSIDITIKPPLWLTWWAFVLYAVVMLSIILLIRKYTINRMTIENELKQNQEKLLFFLNVSHEFRTPITLLLLPIKRILKSNDLAKAKEAAHEANTSAHKLMNLTNQLLDYRKTDMGHLPLKAQKINIVEYTHALFKLFHELASSNDIQMTFSASQADIQAWIDPDKFEKILTNLLSNAIKFTNCGGSIHLSLSFEQMTNAKLLKNKQRKFVVVQVTDTGKGISRERVDHVFDRFYSDDKPSIGTGIGLHYTKKLVELHRGYIKAESRPSEGSTFTVAFPLGDSHLAENQKNDEEFLINEFMFDKNTIEALTYDLKSRVGNDPMEGDVHKTNLQRRTVLVVDDNSLLRQQLRQELSKQYKILEAENGLEGWTKIKKHMPDLVLSDVMMPVMDGIMLCNRIKNDDEMCHIPVVLLTARGSIEHQVEGYEIGADAYVQKPFHIEVLQSRIQNILDTRKRLRERFLSSGNAIISKAIATNNQEELFLDKLTQLVLNNISDLNFGLTDIQEKLRMSRTNLYLKVNKLTGASPSIFVRTVKLKYAAELLTQEKYSIKEICFLSGFKNASHFNQLFKEAYEVTPLHYRKKNKHKTDDN